MKKAVASFFTHNAIAKIPGPALGGQKSPSPIAGYPTLFGNLSPLMASNNHKR
jgi:hypothetical protein